MTVEKPRPVPGRDPGSAPASRRLAYHPPLHAEGLLAWLGTRAIPGVEEVSDGTYRRSLRLPGSLAVVELTPLPDHVSVRLAGAGSDADPDMLDTAVAHCRAIADLDADPAEVDATLGADPMLAALVAGRPGLRVPGTSDGFELACRAVLGQQITVAGARTLAARMSVALGSALPVAHPTITRLFPTPDRVAGAAEADLTGLGLTGARARTLIALADAVAGGDLVLDRATDRAEAAARLLALPGIGPWTVAYVAMRALGDADALPSSDLGLLRGSALLGGPSKAAELDRRSAAWRPWRAYAAMHLWAHAAAAEPARRARRAR